jgi:multidrug efflux pump subunit AcrB
MVEYRPENAIAKVSRTDGKVQISVEADVNDGVEKTTIQRGLEDYVAQQALPTGISYSVGGENEANAALITAVGTAFFLSILAIFAILVLQFNSFSQPAVILYSVVMALPFVMI